MEKAGKFCLTWNSSACSSKGGEVTELLEQGVLWGPENLVKDSKFKINGDGDGRAGGTGRDQALRP